MQLFDPRRPEASPGRKALLIDGSAVPLISVFPVDNTNNSGPITVELSVMVREYDSGELYSYTRKSHFIAIQHVATILLWYYDNPEAVLDNCFGWKPQVPSENMRAKREPLAPEERQQLQAYLDLA